MVVGMKMSARMALVALGSNMGNRPNAIRAALRCIESEYGMNVVACSALCASPPLQGVGGDDDGGYVNAVALVDVPCSTNNNNNNNGDDVHVRGRGGVASSSSSRSNSTRSLQVLRAAMEIERTLGRERGTRRNEPRPIDIDVLMDTDVLFDTNGEDGMNRKHILERHLRLNEGASVDELLLPHPRMTERSFVLFPIIDILRRAGPALASAHRDAVATGALRCARSAMYQYLHAFVSTHIWRGGDDGSRRRLLRLAREQGLCRGVILGDGSAATRNTGQMMLRRVGGGGGGSTQVMGIVNVTPDSFSDGGKYGIDADDDADSCAHVERVVRDVEAMLAAGVDILDIGGQSTRPGAPSVGNAEEIRRVIPIIRALDARGITQRVPVSIDTYSAEVAAAAVAAGAVIVNDVSAGTMDPDMLKTVAAMDAGVAYVMMHMRGDPSTMQSKANTRYDVAVGTDDDGSVSCGDAEDENSRHGVAVTVGRELGMKVARAVDAGIDSWRIGVDPGIGFAKTREQSADLLRHLETFRRSLPPDVADAPMLAGTSRKSFLSRLMARHTAEDAKERDYATAASISACVAKCADIVRVHNVQASVDAVRVADSLLRPPDHVIG